MVGVEMEEGKISAMAFGTMVSFRSALLPRWVLAFLLIDCFRVRGSTLTALMRERYSQPF
jgi:hypothetical protein